MQTSNISNNLTKNSKLFHLFQEQLQDIYWAEMKLVKTLPNLQEAATSEELRTAFGDHLQQTKNHVSRLENVFQIIGEEPKATKCHAMTGLVDEGNDLIDETEEGTAQRDAGLIFAAQKVEHYEIATYGGLKQLALTLGYNDAAEVLGKTLHEEKNADSLLTKIAEGKINQLAKNELTAEMTF